MLPTFGVRSVALGGVTRGEVVWAPKVTASLVALYSTTATAMIAPTTKSAPPAMIRPIHQRLFFFFGAGVGEAAGAGAEGS